MLSDTVTQASRACDNGIALQGSRKTQECQDESIRIVPMRIAFRSLLHSGALEDGPEMAAKGLLLQQPSEGRHSPRCTPPRGLSE